MTTNQPPPKVLYIHNGSPAEGHVEYLRAAGVDVADAHVDGAVAEAVAFQPDIIVLDFEADGDVIARLKEHDATKHIPIIALAELAQEKKSTQS
jgi:DNA-binding response OmpR family regulator